MKTYGIVLSFFVTAMLLAQFLFPQFIPVSNSHLGPNKMQGDTFLVNQSGELRGPRWVPRRTQALPRVKEGSIAQAPAHFSQRQNLPKHKSRQDVSLQRRTSNHALPQPRAAPHKHQKNNAKPEQQERTSQLNKLFAPQKRDQKDRAHPFSLSSNQSFEPVQKPRDNHLGLLLAKASAHQHENQQSKAGVTSKETVDEEAHSVSTLSNPHNNHNKDVAATNKTRAIVTLISGDFTLIDLLGTLHQSWLASNPELARDVDFVVLFVEGHVDAALLRACKEFGLKVQMVTPIVFPHMWKKRLTMTFTKFRAFELYEYKQVVFLDLDLIFTAPAANLFDCPALVCATRDIYDVINTGVMVVHPRPALVAHIKKHLDEDIAKGVTYKAQQAFMSKVIKETSHVNGEKFFHQLDHRWNSCSRFPPLPTEGLIHFCGDFKLLGGRVFETMRPQYVLGNKLRSASELRTSAFHLRLDPQREYLLARIPFPLSSEWPELRVFFETHGFVPPMPALLSAGSHGTKGELDAARSAISRFIAQQTKDGTSSHSPKQFVSQSLLQHRTIMDIARHLLNTKKPRLFNVQILSRLPQEVRLWGSDVAVCNRSVSIWIGIESVPMANSLWVVEGSHLEIESAQRVLQSTPEFRDYLNMPTAQISNTVFRKMSKFLLSSIKAQSSKVTIPDLSAGDIFAFHGRLWHAEFNSYVNDLNRTASMIFTYMHPDCDK